MADIGRALISKIIREQNLTTAVEAGIRATWFEDQEHRNVYKWIIEYYGKYGEVPTKEALSADFPTYRLSVAPEPYEYYVDKFKDLRKRAILVESIIGADEALKGGNLDAAQGLMSQALIKIGKEVTSLTDDDAVQSYQSRYDLYVDSIENSGKLRGIPTGFPTLDFMTSGFLPQQFILFGGAPKQCKSFMLMKSAIAAQEAGYKVLFLSFEMSIFEQLVRYDAMCCNVNSSHLLKGTLSQPELKKLRRGMKLRVNMEPFIISADISASTTVSGLAAKIEQHKPDIVFVDGVYLMENDVGAEKQTPAAYTAISRGLKRLAQRTGKPVVGTTQSLLSKMGKDGAVTMGSLGWSSAWAQDSDLILGVEHQDAHTVKLRIVGGRNVSLVDMSIACNWEECRLEEVPLTDDEDYEYGS